MLLNLTKFKRNINIALKLNVSENALIDICIAKHDHVTQHEGSVQANKIAKETLRLVSRYILYQVTSQQLGPRWIKTKKDGIPSYLKLSIKDKKLIRSCPHSARNILTILSFYKMFRDEPDYNIESVTGLNTSLSSSETIEKIKVHIPKILKTLRIGKFIQSDSPPQHVTTKAGAYGPKAMGITSIFDLAALNNEGLLEMVQYMYALVYTKERCIEIQDLLVDTIRQYNPMSFIPKQSSRHHFISEGGGKTRVIVIGDIWTQIALKPIHDFIMDRLKTISWDGTSSHNNIATKLCKWTIKESFYCYDLTAATDRMPILLQSEVLKPIFGDETTNYWKQLLINRRVESNGKLVKYAVGQPMGFLSSWAAMALTHHIIINYCYEICRVKPRDRRYAVIGDDMAISNKEVADVYVSTLKALGMEISIGKSIIPSTNKNIHSAEIAKRYFRNGVELSPITPESIRLSTNSLEDLLSLHRILVDRSYYHYDNNVHSTNSVPGALTSQSTLISLVSKLKDTERLKGWIFLSSPQWELTHPELKEFVASDSHPITRCKELVWNNIYSFNHRYEQFQLRLLTDKIIQYENEYNKFKKELSVQAIKPDLYSPLVENYFNISIKEMRDIIKVYNTHYIDEEGDSDDILSKSSPLYILNEIITRPSPLDKPKFQSRFHEKTKLSVMLLIKFIESHEVAEVPLLKNIES